MVKVYQEMTTEHVIQTLQKKYFDVSTNLINYVRTIEPYNYYDVDIYVDVSNRQKCDMFEQRLRTIEEGLHQYSINKNELISERVKIDNKWIKDELKSIEVDLDKFKASVMKCES